MFLQQLQQHQAHMCTCKHAGMCTFLNNHTRHVKKQPQNEKNKTKLNAKTEKCKHLPETLSGRKKTMKNLPFILIKKKRGK